MGAAKIDAYKTPSFRKDLNIINKDMYAALKVLGTNVSKAKSLAIPVEKSAVSAYANQKTSTAKAHKALMAELFKLWDDKDVKIAKLEKLYDRYCQEIAELEAANDRWTAVVGADVILKFSAWLSMAGPMRENLRKHAVNLIAELEQLMKDLKKAEREELYVYAKNGISLAWAVATAVIPPLRALSAIQKLGAAAVVVISSDAVLGTKSDLVEDGTTTAMDGLKLVATAKKLEKAAAGLGKANLLLKVVITKGDLEEIADAPDKADAIRARIESVQKSMVHTGKLIGQVEATMVRNKAVFKKMEKNMAAQISKGRDAKLMTKALIAKRKR